MAHTERSEYKHSGVCSLSYHVGHAGTLNSGHQVWRQVPLPLSHGANLFFILFRSLYLFSSDSVSCDSAWLRRIFYLHYYLCFHKPSAAPKVSRGLHWEFMYLRSIPGQSFSGSQPLLLHTVPRDTGFPRAARSAVWLPDRGPGFSSLG